MPQKSPPLVLNAAAPSHSHLVDERCDLDRFPNQAITGKRPQRQRQLAGVDHVHRDDLKAFSHFVSLDFHRVTDFELFPNQIIQNRLRRQ
mgnify:CR=1 FL=1